MKILDSDKSEERKISDMKAIWGIENMRFSDDDIKRKTAFLNGEISEEELLSANPDPGRKGTDRYRLKSEEEQKRDAEIIARVRWRPDIYFEQLQLRNRLDGVETYAKVNVADKVVSSERFIMADVSGKCDENHFMSLHGYLFQDIYYFAGKLRDVPLAIDPVTRFVPPKELPEMMKRFFKKLKQENNLKGLKKEDFVDRLADYLTDINIIHPFREGNGRTKRVFFQELARQAGYDLDWSKCSGEEWISADECAFDSSRDGERDVSYLKALLDKATEPINNTDEENKLSK